MGSDFSAVLERLLAGDDLDPSTVERVFGDILDGALTPSQIAGFAVAFRAKGETADEIAAAARALRSRAFAFRPFTFGDEPLLDTCGTGGDGASTFNVSTVAAVVVAACGVRVAKHGNRAISSRAGSADVVEALGIPISPAEEGTAAQGAFDARLARSLDRAKIAFLFAPRHHGALRHAAASRRELGVRTVFNLLGPLANPAGATHQLLGVFDGRRRRTVAEVLRLLGTRSAWVVHAAACDGAPRGLDEVSPCGPTSVTSLGEDGSIREWTLSPSDAGLEGASFEALRGGDALENAAIARRVLAGERSPRRDAVVLNAACALVVAGVERDLRAARERAEAAIDRGDAETTLCTWRAIMTPDPSPGRAG